MNDLAPIAAEVPKVEERIGGNHRMRLSLRPASDSLDHEGQQTDTDNALPRGDELDELGVLMVPASVAKNAAKLVDAEAAELFRSGLRGMAGKALLSRDIAVSRAHVKLFQALLDAETQRVGRGKGNLKTARFYMDLLDRQHRRLTTSCELLLRLEIVPSTSFQVRADAAAFLVSNNGGTPNVG